MVKVYYANIENNTCDEQLIKSLNPVRAKYVESITNCDRKKQSVWVWKLLEFALNDYFGRNDYNFSFNGSYFCVIDDSNVNFSLTHSKNIVAVAVSKYSVGVDVEACTEKVLKLKKHLNMNNLKQIDDKTQICELTLEWTKKESLLKAKNAKNFKYVKINDMKNDYFLTVCSDEDYIEFIKIEL